VERIAKKGNRRNHPMNKPSSTTETNAQAAQKLQLARGLEIVSGFIFELPTGLKVIVISGDDPFFNAPYEAGTKITPFTSAEAEHL
jgi:hypothetical protein